MKIYNSIDEFKAVKNAVVTIGTFDGVHLGHRKIISRITELAKDMGGESVILTFFPHPRMILHPEDQDISIAANPDMAQRRMVRRQSIVNPFESDMVTR